MFEPLLSASSWRPALETEFTPDGQVPARYRGLHGTAILRFYFDTERFQLEAQRGRLHFLVGKDYLFASASLENAHNRIHCGAR